MRAQVQTKNSGGNKIHHIPLAGVCVSGYLKKELRGKYGSNFDGKYFLIKYVLFDAVFYADSEYHVYCA
jgi:hypothetical protein